MTYINFRGMPRIGAPGVWIGGIPSYIYDWILDNIEEPQWDMYRDEKFLGITLSDEDAIILKLKFKL